MPPTSSKWCGSPKHQLVQAAIMGNPRDLLRYIVVTRDCDLSISNAFLPFICPKLIPRAPIGPQGYKSAIAAKDAMLVIFAQCTTIVSSGFPRESVIELLTAQYPWMLRWFCVFLDNWTETFAKFSHGPFLSTMAHFVRALMDMDSGLSAAVMATPLAVEVCLKLWTQKIDKDRYITGDEGDHCIVVHILERTLEDDSGRDSLLALLHTSPRQFANIISTLIVRIQEIETHHAHISLRLPRFGDLIRLTKVILDLRGQLPQYLLVPIQCPTFILDTCRTLGDILDRHCARPASEPMIVLTQSILFISDMALDDRGGDLDPIKKVKAALDGGLYRIVTTTILHLESIGSAEGAISPLLCLLRRFSVYIVYPEVLRSLIEATAHLPLDLVLEKGYSQSFQACWQAIFQLVQGRKPCPERAGERISVVGLCHTTNVSISRHLSHLPPLAETKKHQDSHLTGQGKEVKSRKCSQCRAVVYCSQACQKQDWNSGHREECTLTANGRSRIDRNLSLQIQASLAIFASGFLSDKGRFQELEVRYEQESRALVTVIDARVLPIKATLASVKDHEKKPLLYTGAETRLSQAYLAQIESDPSIHLVYGFFPWGPLAIVALIRLRRLAPYDFRPLSASVIGVL